MKTTENLILAKRKCLFRLTSFLEQETAKLLFRKYTGLSAVPLPYLHSGFYFDYLLDPHICSRGTFNRRPNILYLFSELKFGFFAYDFRRG